ncbi:MAG: hypothetical protein ACREMB_01735 [Candidatus Rokuibacteriota bacterium]
MRSAPYLAVVRRGNVTVYQFLKEHFERPGLVHVIWDRRVTSRRTTRQSTRTERRRRERRGRIPNTWAALGFRLVRQQDR